MKIIIADFKIAKYGGIIENVISKMKACISLGHTVDIIQFSDCGITQNNYNKKIAELESGEFSKKLVSNSQNGGYEYNNIIKYWFNSYYGFILPPSNCINVFAENAVEYWYKITKDVDLIMWNFMPTKNVMWNKNGEKFDFWYKFFDLPNRIKQTFVVHDAYFDVRASNVTALKDKILFLECAHLAAYKCCENIGIPRVLLLNPRYIDDNTKMPIINVENRKIDFFAAHIFKSMKHVDDIVRSVYHLGQNYTIKIAGSGIEQAYMVSGNKCKSNYKVNKKTDPDIDSKYYGLPIWEVAIKFGMQYLGQISSSNVNSNLRNAKFAIDASYSKHYANYCNTHINGFIIEAMLQGCYPILRDYRGLIKDNVDIYDPLFENIKAIYIPWDATPKQFAKYLLQATKMSSKQYIKDTKHNFELVCNLFNARLNMEELFRLVNGGRKLINKDLEIGKDSENVKKISNDIMQNFFGIDLPIEWEN